MKKSSLTLLLALVSFCYISAQKLGTKDAVVSFDASSSLEAIKANNKSGQLVLNTQTGEVAARVLIKNFIFKQALMQQHFNENYMESTKFPNATLTGKVADLSKINFAKDGTYNSKIKGQLEMHGVKKDVEVPVAFTVKGGVVSVNANFTVLCADYGIAIPSVVADKVAKEAKISVQGTLSNK
jgi:YceI-like domain